MTTSDVLAGARDALLTRCSGSAEVLEAQGVGKIEKLGCGVINGLMEVQSLRGRFCECETKAFHGLHSVLNLFLIRKRPLYVFFGGFFFGLQLFTRLEKRSTLLKEMQLTNGDR